MEKSNKAISNELLHLNAITNPIGYEWSGKILGKFTYTKVYKRGTFQTKRGIMEYKL
ncbi:MAG: hypothetical protein FWG14_02005 [Peptococcaceae bacterium]|nr:hypothetical protein [Peptococcaceae bacterium]